MLFCKNSKTKGLLYSTLLLSSLFLASPAIAQCVDPVAEEGDQIYNTSFHTMQFCNGTEWVSMSTVTSSYWNREGSSISYVSGNVGIGIDTPETSLHVAGVIKAGNAIRLANENSVTNCSSTSEGDLRYNTNTNSVEYCDASDWFTIGSLAKWLVNGDDIYYLAGNLGLGTNNPSEQLHVKGNVLVEGKIIADNSSGYALTTLEGNVGIGTDSPTVQLQVGDDSSSATGTAPAEMFRVARPGTNTWMSVRTDDIITALGAAASTGFVGTLTNHGFDFKINNSTRMTLSRSGNLGIGSSVTGPLSKLAIGSNGNASYTVNINNGDAYGLYSAGSDTGLVATGANYGLYATSTAAGASAVKGIAAGTNAYGLYGNVSNSGAYGVYGTATGDSSYGVYGIATGTSSVGGYFSSTNGTALVTGDGNVGIGTTEPSAKLAVSGRIKDVTGYVAPVGTITMYGGTTAPEGWLFCNGGSYSTSAYPDLFAAIGYNFGGSGASFNVPNFSGVVPKGVGSQNINGRAKSAGAIGTVLEDQMQRIYGTFPLDSNAHTRSGALYDSGGGLGSQSASGTGGAHYWVFDSTASPNSRASSATDGQTRDSSLAVNFIIKY